MPQHTFLHILHQRPGRRYPIETRKRFVELRGQGLSFAAISQKMGVSKPTLIKWSKQYDSDIQEQAHSTQEAQESTLLKVIHRTAEALKERDLKAASTPALLSTLIRALTTYERWQRHKAEGYDPIDDIFKKLKNEKRKEQ